MNDSDQGRVFFHRPPEGRFVKAKGKVYGLNGPEARSRLEDIAGRPELLNQVEADLAMVSYDPVSRRWRLIRDFGPTPLYYSPTADGFFWSFTYQGLISQLPDPVPDESTMFDYLATHYRYIFRDPGRTFHQGVFQVPAGCYADIDECGVRVTPWVDLSHDPEVYKLSPDEAAERLMEIIRRSVRLRVEAADRPAFTVSSGLDSSTVASLASEYLGDIDVFSVGYNGPGVEEYDETKGVAELVAGKNWRWTNLVLERPDLVADTKKLIEQTSSPVVTVTWLAYYLMARQLTGFSEVFNGLGGDENLAGEYGHFFYFFADLHKDGLTERLESEVEAWSRLHDHPVFKKNAGVLKKFWERNIDFNTMEMRADPEVYQANWRFFNPQWLEAHGRSNPPMPRPYPNFLSNRLYQEITYETTPPTLWGLLMANQTLGLTGVSPLMSVPLFKFCLSLPGMVKYDQGLTKALLRRGLKGVLPDSLRLSPVKTGFNAPTHQWFNQPGTAAEALELILNSAPVANGWLTREAVRSIFAEHAAGQANHMMLLWPLLNASLFL